MNDAQRRLAKQRRADHDAAMERLLLGELERVEAEKARIEARLEALRRAVKED